MVFLTRILCKRKPEYSPFYKWQQIFRCTGHMIGRCRSENKLARSRVDLDWAKQTRAIRAGIVEQENKKFVELRLTGACNEHEISLATFLHSLAEMSIQLDKVSLQFIRKCTLVSNLRCRVYHALFSFSLCAPRWLVLCVLSHSPFVTSLTQCISH